MPQNNYIEQCYKEHGKSPGVELRKAKRAAREIKLKQKLATTLTGIKGKLFAKKMHRQKVDLKKNIKLKECKEKKTKKVSSDPLPAYLLDREEYENAKDLNSKIKQRRQEKAAKFTVPIASVQGVSEKEVFGVIKSGKRGSKSWKRMVTKPCFVGQDFTRKAPKFERFIRPMAMRFKKAHVTHPDLNITTQLPIIGVKKNPHSDVFTGLGVLTKGTIIEVNVSELGMINNEGKVIWGKYAQVTNHPENDGCVNSVLLA